MKCKLREFLSGTEKREKRIEDIIRNLEHYFNKYKRPTDFDSAFRVGYIIALRSVRSIFKDGSYHPAEIEVAIKRCVNKYYDSGIYR